MVTTDYSAADTAAVVAPIMDCDDVLDEYLVKVTKESTEEGLVFVSVVVIAVYG